MRRSSLAVLQAQLRRGRLLWPLRQLAKWPAHRLGAALGRPLAGPILASFFTTWRCNLRCRFCDLPTRAAPAGARALLTPDERLAVVEDLAAIGTAAVGFTGGEPAADADLPELIRRAAGRGLVTHLSTNGFAFRSEAAAAPLLDAGLHAVSFSLDGAAAATHDGIRGAGSFAAVMAALQRAVALRAARRPVLSVATVTVITPENVREIPALVALLRSVGVDQIGWMPVHDFAGPGSLCARLDPEALRELDRAVAFLLAERRRGDIENTAGYLGLLRDAGRGRQFPRRCYAGLASLVVDPFGELYPCIPMAQLGRSAGNVRRTRLRDFWRGPGARRMRAQVARCRRCFWNCHAELNLLMAGPTAWRAARRPEGGA
jgi:MoaA/NifB/PqqE/SkfB family radical SAM enzyme